MKLELTTAWTKLNDKFTNKFGAFVRHGSNVEITFETTPVASTQGKVYSLYQTINVDPAIEMYARSTGKESVLTLDENFYEEDGSSSSSDGNQIIEVQYKLEKETFEKEDLPVLNIYDFSNVKLIYDKSKIYYGKLSVKDSSDFLGSGTRVFFNNQYYYIDIRTSSSTTELKSESLRVNQIITLEYFSKDDTILATPDSYDLLNEATSSNTLGIVSKDQITTLSDKYTYDHTRIPYIFNALNTTSNENLLIFLLQQWNRNAFCLVRNLKFTNYDFMGASGNIYGTMFFKLRRATADIPLESYLLNVRIEFSPASSGIKSIERDFSLTKNATTGLFSISTSEIFYDESKWIFNRDNYYTPVNNLIGTFPISDWVDWVDIDPKATNLIVVLEHVENLIATFDVDLKVLKIANDYQYNLNAGTTWNVIRLHGSKIQISSPTNGNGSIVKLVNAFFYK